MAINVLGSSKKKKKTQMYVFLSHQIVEVINAWEQLVQGGDEVVTVTCWGDGGFVVSCRSFPIRADFQGCDKDDGDEHHDKGGEHS